MPLVAAYFRPDTIDEALSLLAEPRRIPLAGGTRVNADRTASDLEVVDLQALGLGGVHVGDGSIRIGATTTFEDLLRDTALPAWLRELARTEVGSALRTLATVGGMIAQGSGESVLLAGLLAAGARVELAGVDDQELDLLLASGVAPASIVTAVEIETGDAAVAATGRTPADTPIVAAVAHASGRVAVTGADTRPVLVDERAPAVGLEPPADFRGSADYRLELVRILTARATEALR